MISVGTDMSLLNNLSIKYKHLVILGLVVVGLLLITFISVTGFSKIDKLNHILLDKQMLATDILEMRKHEKDFLSRKDVKYIDKFKETQAAFAKDAEIIQVNLAELDLDQSSAQELSRLVASYGQDFLSVAESQIEIGLDPKSGLYGSLRSAVHEVETLAKAEQEYELLFHMLMLRRNEKDFMLRRDMKYLAKFDANIGKFNDALSRIQPPSMAEMQDKLANYQRDFKALVDKKNQIGLAKDQGLQGKLRATVHSTDEALESLRSYIDTEIHEQSNGVYQALTVAILITFAVLSSLMVMVSRAIYKPVESITNQIHDISEDLDLTRHVGYKSKDEVGILSNSFDSLIESLRNTVNSVQGGAIQVAQASEEMSSITSEVGQASEQQQLEIEQAVTAINEMTATIQSIAENADSAASAVNEVTTEIGRGKQVADIARN